MLSPLRSWSRVHGPGYIILCYLQAFDTSHYAAVRTGCIKFCNPNSDLKFIFLIIMLKPYVEGIRVSIRGGCWPTMFLWKQGQTRPNVDGLWWDRVRRCQLATLISQIQLHLLTTSSKVQSSILWWLALENFKNALMGAWKSSNPCQTTLHILIDHLNVVVLIYKRTPQTHYNI